MKCQTISVKTLYNSAGDNRNCVYKVQEIQGSISACARDMEFFSFYACPGYMNMRSHPKAPVMVIMSHGGGRDRRNNRRKVFKIHDILRCTVSGGSCSYRKGFLVSWKAVAGNDVVYTVCTKRTRRMNYHDEWSIPFYINCYLSMVPLYRNLVNHIKK